MGLHWTLFRRDPYAAAQNNRLGTKFLGNPNKKEVLSMKGVGKSSQGEDRVSPGEIGEDADVDVLPSSS